MIEMLHLQNIAFMVKNGARQLTKLMTLGLTRNQAESQIVNGFLK